MKEMRSERHGDRKKDRYREREQKWELLVQQYRQLYHRRDDNDSLIVMLSISLVKSL